MLSRRRILAALAGLPAARVWAFQEPEFRTGVSVVNVLATVRDRDGKIVGNLTAADFQLEEEGRPQDIRYFSSQNDLPLLLGLLVDSSGSVRRVLDEEKRAARKFVRQVIREDSDRAFILHFDREVELLRDLTSSLRLLEQAIDDIEAGPGLMRTPPFFQFPLPGTPRFPSPFPTPRPPQPSPPAPGSLATAGTCLYDAVFLAADEILRSESGRKAMILISDGLDAGSKVSLSTAIEAAQRADSLIYTIRFSGSAEDRFDREADGGLDVLARMARETGGASFDATGREPLDRVFASIEEELRNQYSLGYTPSEPGSGYRKIRVTAKRPGLTVRAREGYYARA